MICSECGSPKIENRDLMLCGSCNQLRRKLDRAKAVLPKEPIAKVSKALAKERAVYATLRQKFLLNKWCAYHGRPCIPTEVHHSAGRTGVNENGVPRLLDVETFVPLCSEAHRYIEEHPNWAKVHGYSESRLI
jgi:predicted GNAT family acetyltransferase